MINICLLLLISKTLCYHTNSSNQPSLNWNCRYGNLEKVRKLILEDNVKENSYTLIEAVSSGNLDLVKFLVEERGLVPKITTLRTAASFGNLDVVR